MNVRHSFRTLGLIALTLPVLAFAARGDLMQITSTTRMGGPMAMPPRTLTRQQCVAGREQLGDPATWDRRGECKATDVHRTATGATAHLVCRQGTADFKVRILPGGGAHGTMHMVGHSSAMNVVIDQTFDAKRIGACDAAPPAH